MTTCQYPDYLPHNAVQTESIFTDEQPCDGELATRITRKSGRISEVYQCDTCGEVLSIQEVMEIVAKKEYEIACDSFGF